MVKSKKYAVVDVKRCVACGECTSLCRKDAIRIIDGCYAAADADKCMGCCLCAKSCPVGCISTVLREAERNA